ncbi:Creatinase/aminopeptidase [Cylindrobasidium torrendii FP15055 ss-10]|uniref:Creatinase/aminopeptidase n=1 Tax=Cylindrobasidium torrendii FP15055 ss-10 TaxID=1314674 RepID=A0A0D7B855_9AGAR|nr:Creatinase/aminopeptidase [Cylindrobasidium torrendii FP15055 ss-10]
MAPPPPPPPPPPPLCLPFFGNKEKRRLSFSSTGLPPTASNEKLVRHDTQRSYGSTSTGRTMPSTPDDGVTFKSDSEKYSVMPRSGIDAKPTMSRSNTMMGSKKGWFGLGKKDVQFQAGGDLSRGNSQRTKGDSAPPTRHNSQSTQASRRTNRTDRTRASQDTLVQSDSMYRRKVEETDSVREVVPTQQRLSDLRSQMVKENLDIYVIPSEDAHGSEYVAQSDMRRQYITGFSGSAGTAIVSQTSAWLVTDSRYWLQAVEQIDRNWKLIRAGHAGEARDWIEFVESISKNKRIGIDGRMLSYDKAITLNSKVVPKGAKLVYPVQNLVDLIWKNKPSRSKDPVFIQPIEFSGEDAKSKIAKVRQWIKSRPPDRPSYARADPKPHNYQIGMLITALDQVAWMLNLRGSDIPFTPVFHAYLYIGLKVAILFLEGCKVNQNSADYLRSMGVERRDYNDIWKFLRKREWNEEGKIIISPESSYTISLVLSSYRTTILPSHVRELMAFKNATEIEGMRQAYLRDGVAFVQFIAWLEDKINNKGYDISEWEAAQRMLEFRRKLPHFMGLAYGTISGSGPNGALPHYEPRKNDARMIDKETPYVNDSGGNYRDGTCDTTRTIHLGRPTPEQCEAYTRVLQGHIAIDTAVFPDGTSGRQLDVLARNALWKEGMNYGHGTGHGFGSYLTVHEGPHGFGIEVPLHAGNVITNEPGYYVQEKWGVRIESALVVQKTRPRNATDGTWLCFERLTAVPIQTKMVNKDMLTSHEKAWLIAHNKECLRKLKPLLSHDKRALDWLKRECSRDIGLAAPVAGGITIDWG